MKAQLAKITVSHRADHGRLSLEAPKSGRDSTSGQLHNDTAYGPTDVEGVVVTRDPELQARLYQRTDGLEGKDFAAALEVYAKEDGAYKGIRRVRLMEKLKTIPIKDKDGKGYKGDSNHCIEVWKLPDGTWKAERLTTYDAHQSGLGSTRPHPAAKLVMRLFKKDVVQFSTVDNQVVLATIVKFRDNQVNLAPLNEANVDSRNRSKDDPFSYTNIGTSTFQTRGLRKVFVGPLGEVKNRPPHTN